MWRAQFGPACADGHQKIDSTLTSTKENRALLFGTSHPDLRLGGFSGFKPPEHIHISH